MTNTHGREIVYLLGWLGGQYIISCNQDGPGPQNRSFRRSVVIFQKLKNMTVFLGLPPELQTFQRQQKHPKFTCCVVDSLASTQRFLNI